MEFDGQYLAYEEYKALGGDLDLLSFNLLEFEARRIIDNRTQNILKSTDEIPQEVKICDYVMISRLELYDKSMAETNGNLIASENTDGYSVSYLTGDKISEVIKNHNLELEQIMRRYLMGICVNNKHIMYIGVI